MIIPGSIWTLTVALTLTLWGSTAVASECLPLDKDVEIAGIYTKATYPGPPAFHSVGDGDRPTQGSFLAVPGGLCILAKVADAATDQNQITDLFQLTCPLDKPEGSQVKVTGKLLVGDKANHLTRFVLSCPIS